MQVVIFIPNYLTEANNKTEKKKRNKEESKNVGKATEAAVQNTEWNKKGKKDVKR